jgi:hypothetical protein
MEYINKTDSTLWIFGDSFTEIRHGNDSWPNLLHKEFIGKHLFVSGQGSRDIQTIIDVFLKNLHKIKENDFVILMLPVLFRFRLPLQTPLKRIEHSNPKEHNYDNLFIGNNLYNSIGELEKIKDDSFENMQMYNAMQLEPPLCYVNPHIFRLEDNDVNKKKFTISSVIGMINCSKAVSQNYNEILSSFKNHFTFKIKFYSWTDELDNSIVDTKYNITQKCGMWHTLKDVWNETDGIDGNDSDVHWSKKMDKLFAEMIIKENPNYFNQNI